MKLWEVAEPGIEFMLAAFDSVSVLSLLNTRATQSQAVRSTTRRRVRRKRRKKRRRGSPRRGTGARRRRRRTASLLHKLKEHSRRSNECSKARCLSQCMIRGSSSSSQGEEESSSCLDSEDFDDSAALFGLARKEMAKPEEACRLDDFPSKQLGFVVSHVTEMLGATDVYECGGELEAWTQSGFT